MSRLIAFLVLVLCITVSAVCVASTQAASDKVFSLPEENGNIILAGNASIESETQYYYDNYTSPPIHAWYLPMFTTGNGTTNIQASAHNCNLTIYMFKQATTPMEAKYMYNSSSSIDFTVSGDGTAHINVGSFYSNNLAVYINGVLRQQGDGWNLTEGYIALQGPADVTAYSSETDYWPPRGAPHDEMFPYNWILLTAAIVSILVIVSLLAYRHHLHKQPKTV